MWQYVHVWSVACSFWNLVHYDVVITQHFSICIHNRKLGLQTCYCFACITTREGYESLNGNLRLVLLTQVSMNFYHPNASTGNCANTFLLTVRLCFVVFIN